MTRIGKMPINLCIPSRLKTVPVTLVDQPVLSKVLSTLTPGEVLLLFSNSVFYRQSNVYVLCTHGHHSPYNMQHIIEYRVYNTECYIWYAQLYYSSAETNSKFYYSNSCEQNDRIFNYSLNMHFY